MKRRTKALVLALVLTMTTLFAACGTKTLEDYYGNAVVKAAVDKQFDTVLEQYSSIFSDMNMEVKENVVTYNYYYVAGVEINPDLITMDSATFEAAKDAIEKEAKIRPDEIVYNYYDADGKLIKTING